MEAFSFFARRFWFVFHVLVIYLFRWATLKEALVEKRSKLGESQNLQQFIRDVDDVEGWISEKMQTALEESYKDPSNIQVRCDFLFHP